MIEPRYAAISAEDPVERMRAFGKLLRSEWVLLLKEETQPHSSPIPHLFPLSAGPTALAFSSPERLAKFVEGEAFYAVLHGRELIQALSDQDIGLGIDLGSDDAALLGAESLSWLAGQLADLPPILLKLPEGARSTAQEDISGQIIPILSMLTDILPQSLREEVSYYTLGIQDQILLLLYHPDGVELRPFARALQEALLFEGIDPMPLICCTSDFADITAAKRISFETFQQTPDSSEHNHEAEIPAILRTLKSYRMH